MPVKAGDLAPDFQLKDETGKVRTLAEFGGKLEATKIHKIINEHQSKLLEAWG